MSISSLRALIDEAQALVAPVNGRISMTELERAKMDAHIALLKVAEEVGFAAYRVNTKDPSVTYFPEISHAAKLADVALAAVAAARIAENEKRDTIRAAADRIAEAAEAQLRG